MKQIPGFKFYSATSDGKIYSAITNRFLKSDKRVNNSGYESVSLRKNKRTFVKTVHWCIAVAWIGIPKGLIVNHRNGNKKDNRVKNLEIVTYSENSRHAFKMGLQIPYDRNGNNNPNSHAKRALMKERK